MLKKKKYIKNYRNKGNYWFGRGDYKSMVLRMMIRKWGYLKIFIKVSWLFYLFIMYIFFVKDYDKY